MLWRRENVIKKSIFYARGRVRVIHEEKVTSCNLFTVFYLFKLEIQRE